MDAANAAASVFSSGDRKTGKISVHGRRVPEYRGRRFLRVREAIQSGNDLGDAKTSPAGAHAFEFLDRGSFDKYISQRIACVTHPYRRGV